MSSDPLLQEIIQDTRELVLRAAHRRKKTIQVSPEVAALLERIPSPGAAPVPEAPQTGGLGREDAAAGLAALEAEVRTCTKCDLCRSRIQTVFGVGNPLAGLVFVGEAPGADEDRQGIPFVGRAGQLLTRIIERGMGLQRDSVYICNVLKCRPPGNRDPQANEVALCEPYLIRQLELIRPNVICCLGRFAAQCLLRTEAQIGRLRGKWHFYHDIPVRVTYHPSYLLRCEEDPERSRRERMKVWEDVKAVLRVLQGEEHPEP